MSARMDEPLDPAAYARLVRRALGDLPEDTVDDLLEDLDEHLAEVASEDAGPLTARLGPPRAYASELRRAAGLPEPAALRAARSAPLREAAARLSREPAVRSALAFLVELRPAWWVLRALVAVLAVLFVFGVQFFGLLVLLLVPAAVVLSVRLGRRTARAPAHDHRPLRQTRVVNAGFAAAAVLAFAFVLSSGSEENSYAGEPVPYGPGISGGTLVHEDRTAITNIYPYSSAGQPLSGVLLYDQAGRPISNLTATDEQGRRLQPVLPTDAPPPPGNAFPQAQQVTEDEYGQPVPPAPVPPAVVPPVVVVPSAAPTTAAPTVAPRPTSAPTSPTVPARATTPAAPTTAAPTPTR